MRLSSFLLPILAIALPWELYQRIPFSGLTLTKTTGAALILCAILGAARTRFKDLPRTGLEAPMALFAAACLLSLPWSLARAESLFLLRVYFTYLLVFYAVAWSVRDAKTARSLFILFTLSSAGVAALTLACYMGLAKPTWWYTAFWPQQTLIQEWRDGLPMRMAAASVDFNQAALPLVLAYGLALNFLAPSRFATIRWSAFIALLILLSAAIAISMSRSAVLLVVILTAFFAYTNFRTTRNAWILPVAMATFACVTLFIYRDFATVLFERAQGGVTRDDGSFRNRVAVYSDALSLVPRYLIRGAGLGASDVAIASHSAVAAKTGITLHSTPYKFLLELGALGLLSYLWLWWRAMRGTADRLYRREGSSLVPALRTIGFVCFATLLIQPFQVLSLIPIIMAMGIGAAAWSLPASSKESGAQDSGPPLRSIHFACATLVVGAVVGINIVAYQRTFAKVAAYGDALAGAAASEHAMNWDEAKGDYVEAFRLANLPGFIERLRDAPDPERGLMGNPYFEIASKTYGLPRVYKDMALGVSAVSPQAACALAIGRVLLVQGKHEEAAPHYELAATLDRRLRGALYDLAQVHWARGDFTTAVALYERASSAIGDEGAFGDRARAIDERIEALSTANQTEMAALERASALRAAGRWDETLDACREILRTWPGSAGALFYLGAAKELEGDPRAAQGLYRRAIATQPAHYDAQQRLRVLAASEEEASSLITNRIEVQ